MTLTDDDYRELARQCCAQDFGCIERGGEEFRVSVDTDVDYDCEDGCFNGTGADIPRDARCRVLWCDSYTADGSEVDFDPQRLEEAVYDMLMEYY